MSLEPVCTRCGGPIGPPLLDLRAAPHTTPSWLCPRDGAVEPLRICAPADTVDLASIGAASRVPVWLPAPAPVGFGLGGVAAAGHGPSRAIACALTGPGPFGGVSDLVLVAEEPGTGLGARYAGLSGLDAGDCVRGAAYAKVEVAGHPTSLWQCSEVPDDRAAFVGEAEGAWLWLLFWPSDAAVLLLEHLLLVDAREVPAAGLALSTDAVTQRLG